MLSVYFLSEIVTHRHIDNDLWGFSKRASHLMSIGGSWNWNLFQACNEYCHCSKDSCQWLSELQKSYLWHVRSWLFQLRHSADKFMKKSETRCSKSDQEKQQFFLLYFFFQNFMCTRSIQINALWDFELVKSFNDYFHLKEEIYIKLVWKFC